MINLEYMKNFRPLALFLFVSVLLGSCTVSKPFTLVLLPDTQVYAEKYPDIFYAQTKWIADNAEKFSFVLHQGDITNRNAEAEWIVAARAMSALEGKIPYTVVVGNHDLGTRGTSDSRNADLFNQYFPYGKHSAMPGFGGALEAGKMEKTWYTFNAGGKKWLILSLEFAPRNKVLAWAEQVIKDHPNHKIILNTHAYMYSDDTRMAAAREHKWLPDRYGLGKATGEEAANDGDQIWDKLLSLYPGVMLAFSGHVLNDGVGTLVSTGKNGNKVYQMLANYQMGPNGGNGFLRLVTIDRKNKRISVKTYSPHLDEFNTAADQQFVFEDVAF